MPSATSTIGGCAPGATRTDVLCAAWRIGCWPCCAPCCVRERCLMPASVIEHCALQPNLAPLPQGAARRKGTHPSKNLDRMVGSPSPKVVAILVRFQATTRSDPVCRPHFRNWIRQELPVIRPESGATLSGALESRTDDPKDFIRRGGRPWDRAAPRGAPASSWRGWLQP